jgi:hypothetical protein
MSIITNNGNIFVLGSINNKSENSIDNTSGNIYLGIDQPLSNVIYKIDSNISISLDALNSKLQPHNSLYWKGYNPDNFGNIWHPNNLADINVTKNGDNWKEIKDGILTIKIILENIGGRSTSGYNINGSYYDFHALYLLSETENVVQNTSYNGTIKYNHEGTDYYFFMYIPAINTIEKSSNLFQYNDTINNYFTIVNDDLQEGILTYPLLKAGEKNSTVIKYNVSKLKNILSLSKTSNVKLLFVADDPYYYNRGDTDEIIDTDVSNNNNSLFIEIEI